MATIQLTKKTKVGSSNHVLSGKTKDGMLFVIRHLAPITNEYKGWEVLRESTKVKLVENTFHVSEPTFEAMMQMFLSEKYGKDVEEIAIHFLCR